MNVDTTYSQPVAEIDRLRSRALIAGVSASPGVASDCSSIATTFSAPGSWRTCCFWIALGSMALIMIQHLSGGVWGVFRRVFEASSRTLPLLVVLFIPGAAWSGTLYPWSHPDHVATDEVLRHKSVYLNTPFFFVRAVDLFRRVVGHRHAAEQVVALQDAGDVAVNTRIAASVGGASCSTPWP